MIESNFILPTIISACGVIGTAVCAINRNSLVRSKAREELEGMLMAYPTASAGTPSKAIPMEQKSIPTKHTQFKDSCGQIINADDYLQFVIKGDSMQFCGIRNNDIVFVKKGFELDHLKSFPTPVVIRRDNAPSNETQYKLRRAWGICTIDASEEFVNKIVSSEVFRDRIAAIRFFDGEEALLDDFRRERLTKYHGQYLNEEKSSERYKQVIISTTFHTDINKIRFSIHPASDVIGIVSESFSV